MQYCAIATGAYISVQTGLGKLAAVSYQAL
jgi:hypothetical protein